MKVAITGGAGFIGSHVVDQMVAAGHTVAVLDTMPPHRPDVQYCELDITDSAQTINATRGCEVVFHLAAVSNVDEVLASPIAAVEANILGTANVWEASRRNGVSRTVLASTVWVYAGATGNSPLDEEAPFHLPQAGHLYTSSKIASELLVHNYADLYDVPFTILRYGIPYGPRMREALVIPRFVEMALDGRAITINGDGLQFRNYVYIEDMALAHELCLSDSGRNQVFNLEGAEPVSVRRITETIARVLDRPVAVDFLPDRPGDFKGREVSAAKAKKILGWEATTSFEDGLRRYVDWYRGKWLDRDFDQSVM